MIRICASRTKFGPAMGIPQQVLDGGLSVGLGCFVCGFSVLLESKRRRKVAHSSRISVAMINSVRDTGNGVVRPSSGALFDYERGYPECIVEGSYWRILHSLDRATNFRPFDWSGHHSCQSPSLVSPASRPSATSRTSPASSFFRTSPASPFRPPLASWLLI